MPPSMDGVSGWVEATDEDLLLGVARRDEQALAALYDRYGRRAFGLALRVLGDPGEAEDAVQDTFMRVWHRAATFQPGRGSAGRWLLAIVHYRAIDRLRGRGGHARQEAPLDLFDRVLATEDPWPEVALRLRRDELKRWLAALPEAQRRTLELAYFEGYTQQEVAEATGVSIGTVKGRIRLGLRKLRDLTGEIGGAAASAGGEPRALETPAEQAP